MTKDDFKEWADRILKANGIIPEQRFKTMHQMIETNAEIILRKEYFKDRSFNDASILKKEEAVFNDLFWGYIGSYRQV